MDLLVVDAGAVSLMHEGMLVELDHAVSPARMPMMVVDPDTADLLVQAFSGDDEDPAEYGLGAYGTGVYGI